MIIVVPVDAVRKKSERIKESAIEVIEIENDIDIYENLFYPPLLPMTNTMKWIEIRSYLGNLAISQIELIISAKKYKRENWITTWKNTSLKEIIETYIEEWYREWKKEYTKHIEEKIDLMSDDISNLYQSKIEKHESIHELLDWYLQWVIKKHLLSDDTNE